MGVEEGGDGGGGGGGGWGGGEGGAASWGGGAVDGGSANVFLAAALTRAMRAAVPIPAVASASVLLRLLLNKHSKIQKFSLCLFRCCLLDKLQLAQIRYSLNKIARLCGGSLGVLDKADGKGNEEEAAELQEVRWSRELVEIFQLFQTFSVSSYEPLQILTTKSESVFDS